MLTIQPRPAAHIAGVSARTVLNAPVRLTATTRFHSAGSISQTRWAAPSCFGEMPALLMTVSKAPPIAAAASDTAVSTAA